MASKYSNKRKSYTFLTLNQKQEMLKPIKEGMLNAKICQKLSPLPQTANSRKGKVLKENQNFYSSERVRNNENKNVKLVRHGGSHL